MCKIKSEHRPGSSIITCIILVAVTFISTVRAKHCVPEHYNTSSQRYASDGSDHKAKICLVFLVAVSHVGVSVIPLELFKHLSAMVVCRWGQYEN
jgi:hypothetical protein